MQWFTRNGLMKRGQRGSQRRPVTTARLAVTRLEARENPAPVINNLSAQQIGSSWVVTGQVNDANPAQETVAITGAVSGAATVYDDGSFDFVTSNLGTGTIAAQATDPNGVQSVTASTTVVAPDGKAAPHLSLAVSYNQQRSVTLTGQVIDDISVSGLTVTFNGQVTGSATTASDGTFRYTADAAALGTISASTVDSQNVFSNIPVIRLASKKPSITIAGFMLGGPQWKFVGTVTDQSPSELRVTFGGLISGSAVTGSQGGYIEYATIPVGTHGTVSCQVTNWWGLQSDVAYYSF